MIDPLVRIPPKSGVAGPAAGLACLAAAYPCAAATEHAWNALAVGVSSMITLLLAWVVLVLLRRWKRFPHGAFSAAAAGCVISPLVWLVLRNPGWFAADAHPLPMLLTPVLFIVELLPLYRDESPGAIRTVPVRILLFSGCASVMLLGVGILREAILFGTVFGPPDAVPRDSVRMFSIPLGLMLTGCFLGVVRWLEGRLPSPPARRNDT
ncbi:MAG: hypothetical protein KBA30_03505 [Clostridia bacterium]|nr:hypothetical protein [Clostridia bacterium]